MLVIAAVIYESNSEENRLCDFVPPFVIKMFTVRGKIRDHDLSESFFPGLAFKELWLCMCDIRPVVSDKYVAIFCHNIINLYSNILIYVNLFTVYLSIRFELLSSEVDI